MRTENRLARTFTLLCVSTSFNCSTDAWYHFLCPRPKGTEGLVGQIINPSKSFSFFFSDSFVFCLQKFFSWRWRDAQVRELQTERIKWMGPGAVINYLSNHFYWITWFNGLKRVKRIRGVYRYIYNILIILMKKDSWDLHVVGLSLSTKWF